MPSITRRTPQSPVSILSSILLASCSSQHSESISHLVTASVSRHPPKLPLALPTGLVQDHYPSLHEIAAIKNTLCQGYTSPQLNWSVEIGWKQVIDVMGMGGLIEFFFFFFGSLRYGWDRREGEGLGLLWAVV